MEQLDILAALESNEERLIRLNPDKFATDFLDWLHEPANWKMWLAFKANADAIAKHRKHYSAYTIREYLRHHTMLSDASSEFKVNNIYTPDWARLWQLLNPTKPGFFSTRVMPDSSKRIA